MDLMLIAPLLAGFALLAGLVWFFALRAGTPARAPSNDRLDTVADWPPQATRILTSAERLAHDVLVRALPEYLVLAQVPLARFLRVPTRNSYVEWLRRLGNQCADLVVCDKATQVIAVVDVQAPAHQASEGARKRLNRMARVLKAAQIPLHVWTEGALPSIDAARAALLPKPLADLSAALDVPVAVAVVAAPREQAPSPFDDLRRDSSHDEVIEGHEPPQSTWFDEFNSGPTPLGKPKPK